MKMSNPIDAAGTSASSSSLHSIVSTITAEMELTANNHRSYIVNDIPEQIMVESNKDLVASVFANLLDEVIRYTEHGCIRITAKIFNNVVLMHIKNDGTLNYDSVAPRLIKMQQQAEMMGGFVGFTSYRNKLTTIAFSFLHRQQCFLNLKTVAIPAPVYCPVA